MYHNDACLREYPLAAMITHTCTSTPHANCEYCGVEQHPCDINLAMCCIIKQCIVDNNARMWIHGHMTFFEVFKPIKYMTINTMKIMVKKKSKCFTLIKGNWICIYNRSLLSTISMTSIQIGTFQNIETLQAIDMLTYTDALWYETYLVRNCMWL